MKDFKKIIKKITEITFICFLLFLPLKIDSLFFSEQIINNGKTNIYQSHFINLSQILLLISVIGINLQNIINTNNKYTKKIDKSKIILTVSILILLIINIIFSTNKINSLLYLIKIIEAIYIIYLIKIEVIEKNKIKKIIIISASIISVIAITQFLKQSSIGLNFLGEPIFTKKTLGIAKINIQNTKIIRAYGTFQHPNILAGYLGLSLIFLTEKIKTNKIFKYISIILITSALILTFSRSAFLALTIALIYKEIKTKNCELNFKKIKKYIIILIIIISTIMIIPNAYNSLISRLKLEKNNVNLRNSYIESSIKIIKKHPITGVGLGNFTENLQQNTNIKLKPWEIQPVHNIPLLITSEEGIIMLILLLFLIKKIHKKENTIILIYLCLISIFDHYLITNHQGIEILAIIIGLYFVQPHSKTPYNQLHSCQAIEL